MTIIFPKTGGPALVQGALATPSQLAILGKLPKEEPARGKMIEKRLAANHSKLRMSAIPFREIDHARARFLAYEIADGDPDHDHFNAWKPDPNVFYAFDATIAVSGRNTRGVNAHAWIKSTTKEIDAILEAAAKALMTDTITGSHVDNSICVHINGLPHLKIDASRVVGMHSWIDNERPSPAWLPKEPKYFIEFHFDSGTKVQAEYNDRSRWEEILKLVDKHIDWTTFINP